jgi:serine/threonine protein kinase
MGEVYRARDTRLERDVAVKVLPASLSSDANLRQRLEREAKAVSKLSHPHICTLHDIGHQDGVDFLVMELVEGETLEQRLIKGPLPADQALRIAAQIADALARAHRMGFVHRDLKPSQRYADESGRQAQGRGLPRLVCAGTIRWYGRRGKPRLYLAKAATSVCNTGHLQPQQRISK